VLVVIGGTDITGFLNAATLFPLHTGDEIPDYIITSPEFGVAGASNYLAAGFWNNQWAYDSQIGYISF